MKMRLALLLTLSALGSLPAWADVVRLKNGGRIEGRVTDEGDSWKIDTGYGTITLKKEDVAAIEKKDFKIPEKPVLKRIPPRLRDGFAHPFYGFKIYLPVGWQKGPSKGEEQKVSFYGPAEPVFTPRVDLTVRATKMEVWDFVNALKAAFIKECKDAVFPQEEAASLRGRDFYQFLIAFNDGPVVMRALWTIIGFEGRIYTLGFACPEASFETYYSAVDASMRSLRLFPLPSAPVEQRKEFNQLYQQGYAFAKEGKTAEALKAFGKAAALIPEFPDIHGILGQLHVKSGNFVDAEKEFRKALEIDPEDYEFAFNLGVILLRQEKFQDAIDALSRAVKADPAMEPALTNLGVAYFQKGDAEKAAEALAKAVAADPESAPAHFNLGTAYERLDRKKEAEAEFKETLKIDPKHQGAKDGLARLRK